MSTIPHFPTPASPEQLSGDPAAVQLTAAGPARQRRLTVFFRLLMAIPHGIILYFLAIAAEVIVFIGWWAALFTGRLPEFAHTYLTGYIAWNTRVQAYLILLTDAYPPFSLDDDSRYPVRLAVPPAASLNRAAVLFRAILVIPVALLAAVVEIGGMTIVGIVAWLIALITGQLPVGLHQAYASIVRYAARVNCYFFLLTPAYPAGLFGDGPPAPATWAEPPPASDLPTADDIGSPDATGYGSPGYAAPGYASAGYAAPGYAEPAYAAPGVYGAPAGYGAPASPADWRLVLTAGARQLVSLFIGMGVVLWVAWIALIAVVAATVPASAVPAGYQRVGGAAQGISVAAPASWVELNLATGTIENALKKAGLHGLTASTIGQMVQALQGLHPVWVFDVAAGVASPRHYTPNLSAYCASTGVDAAGSAGVPFLKAAMAAEIAKYATHVSQADIEIGGVPGVQTSYQLSSSSAGTAYGSQLEVLPGAGKACFVTATADNPELPKSVLAVAAATAQFP